LILDDWTNDRVHQESVLAYGECVAVAKWTLYHWPNDTAENWEPVGEAVDTDTWHGAVRRIGPITPGRYLIRNESAPNAGQYFLLEPDKTIVPVDAF
jgi:hypothetical protein